MSNQYFARTTRGLEPLAALDISRVRGTTITGFGHRRVDFSYAHAPSRLLGLRSVDDIFIEVARLPAVGHARSVLAELAAAALELPLTDGITLVEAVRRVPVEPAVTITPSLRGQRNYSRYDVEAALAAPLRTATGWQVDATRDGDAASDLDIRVLVEPDVTLFGLRLAAAPLHRRPYKLDSLPGSLKAPVAFCLGLLAQPKQGEVFFDPLGGAGVTMIEAVLGLLVGSALTSDINQQAGTMARANIARARANVQAVRANAAALPLSAASVDAVITDLPWGRQSQATMPLPALYTALLTNITRVLRPGGRAVFLTEQTDALFDALEAVEGLKLNLLLPITLFGAHPVIFLLSGAEGVGYPSYGDGLWPSVKRAAIQSALDHRDDRIRAEAARLAEAQPGNETPPA